MVTRFPTMCCICFNGVTVENAFTDANGTKWDLCSQACAIEAGLKEDKLFHDS